jgi:protein disulfide-isomerase
MKKFIVITLLFLMIMPMMLYSKQPKKKIVGETLAWLTDFEQAKSVAQSHNVPILIDFTGSDWCIWCKKLESEVFEQKAFNDYAKKNLVLLRVDFPRNKSQSEAEKKKNYALAQKFNVEGFPSIVLTDSTGKEINRLGYEPDGPEKYIVHLKDLLSKQSK